MELSILLTRQIGSMFIMMAVGFILIRTKTLKPGHATVVSKILLYTAIPCSIIKSFEIQYTSDKLKGLALSISGAIVAHIIFLVLEKIIRKPLKLHKVESASLIYSNAGNLVIPLVYASLGDQWVFYVSGYMLVQTFLIWTHGKSMLSGEKIRNCRSLFTNINLISVFIGIAVFLTGFQFPSVAQNAIDYMAALIAPLSMILTGMLLGSMKIREIISRKRAYLIAALRLVVFPCIVIIIFALCSFTKLHPDGVQILLITAIACVSASATTITQFAQLYDNEAGYSSIISIMTVLFCIITIPLMIGFYQFII